MTQPNLFTACHTNFPPNPWPPGTQNYRVYEHLKLHGKVTTKELHNNLAVDTARLRSDLRPFLRKHGMDYEVKSIPDDPGNRLYTVSGG